MAKYQDWITPEGLSLVQGWARDGLTDEQIAGNMGINVATLYRWKIQFCSSVFYPCRDDANDGF